MGGDRATWRLTAGETLCVTGNGPDRRDLAIVPGGEGVNTISLTSPVARRIASHRACRVLAGSALPIASGLSGLPARR